ncbi:unnamed protein product, partial [Didymodactylos carnosus]
IRFIIHAALCFISLNLFNFLLDSFMYEQFTYVPLNFFKINILHSNSISSHYGINGLMWYLTNGLPMIFLYRIPLLFVCLFGKCKPNYIYRMHLSIVCLFTISFYSLNIHKEFRFLTQLLPLLFILEAYGLDYCVTRKMNKQWMNELLIKGIYLSFIFHLLIGIYFSCYDRRGQIDVLHWLRKNVKSDSTVEFLMPCHSTPYYSYLHRQDVNLKFLTCEPNLSLSNKNNSYIDEADQFYARPIQSMENKLRQNRDYKNYYLIMFETLFKIVETTLVENNFIVVKQLFNSHIQHTLRHGKMIYVLTKQ